jgi:Peptidase family C25
VEIFDITEPDNPQRMANLDIQQPDGSTYTVSFKDRLITAETKEYIALTPEVVKKPISIVEDAPSNLRSKEFGADYIIITHEDFYDAILPLADHYISKGFRVKVVKVGDIYDEFNAGIFNPKAIKDFLSYTYNNWIKPAPTYVLLVGDGTYDYQDYEGFGCKNFVPTYMVHSLDFGETGCDSWFVCLDGEGDILPDMFIGRFPVKTVDETNIVVNKILNYSE